MQIKAIEAVIQWDGEAGRMAIINAGEKGEVSDSLGALLIEAGQAKEITARKAKAAPVDEAPTETAATDENPADEAAVDEAPAE